MEPATTNDAITVIEHANFAVSDRSGDISPTGYDGFFVADTRFLSRFVLRLGGKAPEPLSVAAEDHGAATFYLASPTLGRIAPNTIAIIRDRAVGTALSERIRLISYALEPLRVRLSLHVGADFADIFEVRGRRRLARSVRLDREPRQLRFSYEHRGYRRATFIELDRDANGTDGTVRFDAQLERGVPWDLNVRVSSDQQHAAGLRPLAQARLMEPDRVRSWMAGAPRIDTDDHRLQLAWEQSVSDIGSLLLSVQGGGFIPAAGVPWYMAVFGRDSTITTMQTRLMGDELVDGTLRQLAAYQGTADDPFREEQPGKIPHEVRNGELATLDHVPHGRYYGSVDATPLYVLLFVDAARWSGWLETDARGPTLSASFRSCGSPTERIASALPAVRAAMAWVDREADADGLIWYRPHHRGGIRNQVWKDSNDSYRFADGRIAEPPIAAVEVQGYVLAARWGWAAVLEALGEQSEADRQRAAARRLAATIEAAFWMPEHGTYAMGLDPGRQQIDAVVSNPGHLLWTGAIPPERAAAVTERLLAPDSFSGWGIRTMSSQMAAYNPISYHNGTVWPHDNSLIAAGMARYGMTDAAWRVIDAQLDAATTDAQHRLPELFAGFDRRTTSDLVRYAVACAPQAWASGAIALFTQLLLGVQPTADGPISQPLARGPRIELNGARIAGWSGTLRTGGGATAASAPAR